MHRTRKRGERPIEDLSDQPRGDNTGVGPTAQRARPVGIELLALPALRWSLFGSDPLLEREDPRVVGLVLAALRDDGIR